MGMVVSSAFLVLPSKKGNLGKEKEEEETGLETILSSIKSVLVN